jgi:hypothetical protein
MLTAGEPENARAGPRSVSAEMVGRRAHRRCSFTVRSFGLERWPLSSRLVFRVLLGSALGWSLSPWLVLWIVLGYILRYFTAVRFSALSLPRYALSLNCRFSTSSSKRWAPLLFITELCPYSSPRLSSSQKYEVEFAADLLWYKYRIRTIVARRLLQVIYFITAYCNIS